MYFDYPLEQGLRQTSRMKTSPLLMYFDYPLEQGLRQRRKELTFQVKKVF